MAAMQQPPPTHTHQSNTTTIMEKLKSSIIQRLTKLQPNKTLSPSQIHSIQLQLQHAFPSFHIPTHPTYSTMIEKAIEELDEEDGSSKEAISEYILANYEDLPWAHKRFLSYYLDKLCKVDEVVCISSNRYSVPRLMDKPSRKKKRLGLRSRRLRKVYPSEVDNLDGNGENVNVGLFQEDEEEAGVLFKRRAKRKRSSLVVEDDEEVEVGGTGIVERHDDVVENSEVPVNDDANVLDGRVEGEEKDDVNEEHDLAACDKVQSVVAAERGSQSALSKNLGDEMNDGDLALAHSCKGKDEQLVSTVDKTLPGEHEEEVRTEVLLSDHVISAANVMLVPSVSIEKSTNEFMDGDPAVVSVSGANSSKDTPDKLVLERKDQDSCAAGLLIVAVEKGSPKSAERREIVCCLHVPQPEEPKMRHAYHPRKKLKQCQKGKPTTSTTPIASPNFSKGAKLADIEELRESTRASDMKLDPKLSESSMLESTLESQRGQRSSAFGSNLMISVVEGSIEREHGKQKLHPNSSPSSHQSELMSMEDGDLNIPLKQVLKMHGKRRKSSLHTIISKMEASSEDPEKKIPQKRKKPTCLKRKHRVLQYGGQKSCRSEAVVALETPHEMRGEGLPGSPQVKATTHTICFDNQNHELGENEQIKGDHGLFHKPGQYDDINPRESSQGEDKNALKDLKHPTERHQQQERPSGPATNLILEKIPEEENDGGIANPPLESPSVKSSSPSHHDMEDLLKQNGSDVQLWGLVLADLAISVKGKRPGSNQQSPQEEKEVKKIECRGRPSKNKHENQDAAESVNSHCLKQGGLSDTVSYEQLDPQNKQRKKDCCGSSPKQKEAIDIVVPLSLHDQQLEEQSKSAYSGSFEASADDIDASASLNGRKQWLSDSGIHQKSDRITIGEQIDATKDAVSLKLHDRRKEGTLEPATCKAKKKDGRGRPRKIKETTIEDVPAPLDLYVIRQKELAQAVICESENKDEGENSSRQTEPVTQDVGAVVLHDCQQEGVLLLANRFLEEKGEQGLSKQKHDLNREDVSVLVHLLPQLKKVPSKTTNVEPRGRGRRRKLEVVQCEAATSMDEVAVQSTLDQLQERSSEQVTSESRKKEMTSEYMVAALNFQDQQQESCEPSTYQHKTNMRPTKQIEATNKDTAANLNLQDQQPEGSSVQATRQMKKDGRMKKDGQGRPPESKVVENSPSDLDLQQLELTCKPAIHSSLDASNVFSQPDERKGQQQNVNRRVDKLPAMLDGPISLRTRSKHGGAHKPEAAETLLGSEADHLGEEVISDDVTLLVDQPCKQEEQHQNPLEKQGCQLRSHTTVLKQKTHNHIPPSAIRRSSRINQQSQIGSICTKFIHHD